MNTNEANTETAAVADQEAPKVDAPKDKRPASKKAHKAAKKSATSTPKKDAKPAAKKEAKPASKKVSKAKAEARVPREFSKKQIVLDMLRRKDGATLAQIAEATDWQAHSIRGFISTVTKKMDLPIASLKNAVGDRFYRIEK